MNSPMPASHVKALLGNEPLLTQPPYARGLKRAIAGSLQSPLLVDGEKLFQAGTDQIYEVDTVTWQDRETPLSPHPEDTVLYNPQTVDPEGRLLYVNQGKHRILAFRDGHASPLVERPDDQASITSDLTVTPAGTLYYGTGNAEVHRRLPGGSEEILKMPCKRSGVGWAFAQPETILPARNGWTFVGTYDGVVGFDTEDKPRWVTPFQVTRACFRQKLLETPDGSKIVYSGADRTLQTLDATTGKTVREYKLVEDGDSFNTPALDGEGNIYTVSSGGTLFKFSPDLEVLWKRPVGTGLGSAVTGAKVEFDAHGNVCVNPNTEHFHVYSPDGVLLMQLNGPEVFDGGRYAFDFTLSEDGTRAYIMSTNTTEGKYHNYLVEVGLPGSAEEVLSRVAADGSDNVGVRVEFGLIRVGGTAIRRRRRDQSFQCGAGE
ncbi:MAG: hypothetical protein AB1758_02480 [Candidatus Eremiobacterota bacterium]